MTAVRLSPPAIAKIWIRSRNDNSNARSVGVEFPHSTGERVTAIFLDQIFPLFPPQGSWGGGTMERTYTILIRVKVLVPFHDRLLQFTFIHTAADSSLWNLSSSCSAMYVTTVGYIRRSAFLYGTGFPLFSFSAMISNDCKRFRLCCKWKCTFQFFGNVKRSEYRVSSSTSRYKDSCLSESPI